MPWFTGKSLQTLSAILTLAGLAACGGKTPPSQPGPELPALPPLDLALAPVAAADYATATPEELLRHLRNGLRVQLTGWAYNPSGVQVEPGTTPCSTPTPRPAAGENLTFSREQYQRVAATEPRQLVRHGDHWLLAQFDRLAALKLDSDGTTFVETAELDSRRAGVRAMSVIAHATAEGAEAVVMASAPGNIAAELPGAWLNNCGPAGDTIENGTLQISLHDLSDLETGLPTIAVIELQGRLITSVKSGNSLHVVTRFDPWLPGLVFERDSRDPALRAANDLVLDSAELDDLLPRYSADGESLPLVDSCLLQTPSATTGLNSLLNVTTIDLATRAVVNNLCLSGRHLALELNESALHLTAHALEGESTLVHRLSLAEEGAHYRAFVEVPGVLRIFSPEHQLAAADQQLYLLTSAAAADSAGELQGLLHRVEPADEDELSVTAVSLPANAGDHGVHVEHDSLYFIPSGAADTLQRLPLPVAAEPAEATPLSVTAWETRRVVPLAGGYLLAERARSHGANSLFELHQLDASEAGPLDAYTPGGADPSIGWSAANLDVEAVDESTFRIVRPVAVPAADAEPDARPEVHLQLLEVDTAAASIELLAGPGEQAARQ